MEKGNVYMIGGSLKDKIEKYMKENMRIVSERVFKIGGKERMWRERMIEMGKRDIIVVLDIRRYKERMMEMEEKERRRGVEVVMVKDKWI